MQEAAIREVVMKYVHAIHTQDKEEFCSIWSEGEGCTLISLSNEFQGVENIYQDFLIGRIQKKYTTIDLIPENIRISMVQDGYAIVVFSYHTECLLRENGEPHGIAGMETQVLREENGAWKLLHVHYSCEATSQMAACRHLATAARVKYPTACGEVFDSGA